MDRPLLHKAIEAIADPVLILDRVGTIEYASASIEPLTGYSSGSLQGAPVSLLMPVRNRELVSRFLAEFFAAPTPRLVGRTQPLFFITKEGRETAIELTIGAFEHAGGSHAVCTVRDCSNRPPLESAAERAIQRLESRLNSALGDLSLVIEHAPAAMAILDREMRYMLASRRWMEDFHLTDSVIGKSHYELFPELPERWRSVHKRCLAGEIVSNDDDSFVRADGKTEYLRWEVVPWRTVDGDVGGLAIFSEVITNRRLAEVALRKHYDLLEAMVTERTAQLERARDEALHDSAAKTRFIAGISHDLRQPLQAAAMLLSSIARRVPAQVSELCDKAETAIFDASDRLTELIDVSRLEEGVLQPRMEAFAINDLLTRVVRTHLPVAEAKGVTLSVMRCNAFALSDPTLLARIVDNLVANAVKYTERGEITAGCMIEGDNARIFVRDTGIGMDEATLARAFDPYVQADNPNGDPNRGYGLGLTICRTIAAALHCELDGQSVSGQGSTFSVVVPLANAAHAPSAA